MNRLTKQKYLSVLLLVIFLLIISVFSFRIKTGILRELYEDVTFSGVSVNANRFVSQISDGIMNGKRLENFYNVKSILTGIQNSSSYMKGVYIVSADLNLLYSSGVPANRLNITVDITRDFNSGSIYSVTSDDNDFFITIPIKGYYLNDHDRNIEGYVIMCVERAAINNPISDIISKDLTQTSVIFLYCFLLGVIIIKRCRLDKTGLIIKIGILISILTFSATTIDAVTTVFRFQNTVGETALQCANTMSYAVQSRVDSVLAKGATKDNLTDLGPWLMKNAEEIPLIDTIYIDSNTKIRAKVSEGYLNSIYLKLASNFLVLSFSALAASILITVTANNMFKRKVTCELDLVGKTP